ncbi:hypothetical protein [Novosphingobium naphthalenivorans]|uniref:hypothetical protein n=1 Tax=Novosphingobium naphthalenivorans TaxID=273168 RepID=UPI0012EDB441|nr:hypothetical protein [Novosphingobium naphthalenivorans]
MTKKKDKPSVDLSNFDFDEASARSIHIDSKEIESASESVKRDDDEAREYVKERRDSIERGARRSRKRFRL